MAAQVCFVIRRLIPSCPEPRNRDCRFANHRGSDSAIGPDRPELKATTSSGAEAMSLSPTKPSDSDSAQIASIPEQRTEYKQEFENLDLEAQFAETDSHKTLQWEGRYRQ